MSASLNYHEILVLSDAKHQFRANLSDLNVVAAFLGKEIVERLEPSGDCVLQTEAV
jgi:hypothetical protein